MASWIGLVRIISSFGSNAAATMVGQNLGAGRADRAEKAVWTAARYNMIFLGSVGVVFLLLAGPIAGLFTNETGVLNYAVACLRIVCLGFVFYAAGMVLTQAFNGAGSTWTPTIINLFVFWLWEIPLAWWLSTKAGWGAEGVFIAMAIGYSSLAVVSAILFRRGKWKSAKV
jgi:Na+-driven multidrug efflux pump